MTTHSDDFNGGATVLPDGPWTQIRTGTRTANQENGYVVNGASGGGFFVHDGDGEPSIDGAMYVELDATGLGDGHQCGLLIGANAQLNAGEGYAVTVDNFQNQFIFQSITNGSATNRVIVPYTSGDITGDVRLRAELDAVQSDDDLRLYVDDALVVSFSTADSTHDYRLGHGGFKINTGFSIDNYIAASLTSGGNPFSLVQSVSYSPCVPVIEEIC